jgi:hypothetical protein
MNKNQLFKTGLKKKDSFLNQKTGLKSVLKLKYLNFFNK